MALAIHFDELLTTGQVSNQAELARLGNVTRARLIDGTFVFPRNNFALGPPKCSFQFFDHMGTMRRRNETLGHSTQSGNTDAIES